MQIFFSPYADSEIKFHKAQGLRGRKDILHVNENKCCPYIINALAKKDNLLIIFSGCFFKTIIRQYTFFVHFTELYDIFSISLSFACSISMCLCSCLSHWLFSLSPIVSFSPFLFLSLSLYVHARCRWPIDMGAKTSLHTKTTKILFSSHERKGQHFCSEPSPHSFLISSNFRRFS